MKRIFTFCIICAFALAATACSDDKSNNKGNDNNNGNGGEEVTYKGTMTLGSDTRDVKSAFYATTSADEDFEETYSLFLFPDVLTEMPMNSGYYIHVEISESCLGKEIDLTKLLTKTGPLSPSVWIENSVLMIAVDDTEVYAATMESEDVTISNGTLKMTRDGDQFTIKFSAELSDGTSAAADWSGMAKSFVWEE